MKGRTVSFGTIVAAIVFLSPGQVLANQFVTGSSSNANVPINSVGWVVIRSATVVIPTTDALAHGCVATASADMDHNGLAGVENHYWFALSLNNANPITNTGSERTLELVDNAGIEDPDSKPVSTTQHYNGLTKTNGYNGGGSHTFYFLGRKEAVGTLNADVLDASLSVSCVHTP